MCSELSNYEKERDENVARNNKFLASLGLAPAVLDHPKQRKVYSKTTFTTQRVQPERTSKTAANQQFSLFKKKKRNDEED